MSPKILVFSHTKILYQLLNGYLNKQYEIIYRNDFERNHDLVYSEQNVYLCIIEAGYFTKGVGELVQKIKRERKVPILFISGTQVEQQKIEEKVQAIDYGIDEYLSQPQSIGEILASVKALIRWYLRVNDSKVAWEYRGLKLYPKSRKSVINGSEIPLTKIEFDIVLYLASQNGRAVTYKELYEKVWRHEYILDDRNIMAHIHRIRKKMEADPQNPIYIHNVYGLGYRFGPVSEKETPKEKKYNVHPLNCII